MLNQVLGRTTSLVTCVTVRMRSRDVVQRFLSQHSLKFPEVKLRLKSNPTSRALQKEWERSSRGSVCAVVLAGTHCYTARLETQPSSIKNCFIQHNHGLSHKPEVTSCNRPLLFIDQSIRFFFFLCMVYFLFLQHSSNSMKTPYMIPKLKKKKKTSWPVSYQNSPCWSNW